jgi:hypothetical protein
MPRPLFVMHTHADRFTDDFRGYLPENLHVFDAFEREALRVVQRGRTHYSARTIIEVLRHNSALTEQGGEFKLSDWHTPYLARLFALMHPAHEHLFEFRRVNTKHWEGAAA